MARKDSSHCGQWQPSPIPQGQNRSPVQQLFEDHADIFAPVSLMPCDDLFLASGWNEGARGRPLLPQRISVRLPIDAALGQAHRPSKSVYGTADAGLE